MISGETITISDSEDSCSQGAHVASLDSQSDADIKNDQNIAGIEIKHEIEETVPKTDIVSPWSGTLNGLYGMSSLISH